MSRADILVKLQTCDCDRAPGVCLSLSPHLTSPVWCLGSSIQERDPWRGRPRPGLAALLQVHGEAAEGRMAQETTEVSGEELAAALLCTEREHTDLPQRWQGDDCPGQSHLFDFIMHFIIYHLFAFCCYCMKHMPVHSRRNAHILHIRKLKSNNYVLNLAPVFTKSNVGGLWCSHKLFLLHYLVQ